MRKFLTTPMPVVGIQVTARSRSAIEIMASILTYLSVSSDLESISTDMRHDIGSKPTLTALKSFIAEEMKVSRIAAIKFPDGAHAAAKMYFSLYPDARSERKIVRFIRAAKRCQPNDAFKTRAGVARAIRRSMRNK